MQAPQLCILPDISASLSAMSLIPHSSDLVPMVVIMPKNVSQFRDFNRVSFVVNAKKAICSQSIPISQVVSSVRITSMGGSSSLLWPFFH